MESTPKRSGNSNAHQRRLTSLSPTDYNLQLFDDSDCVQSNTHNNADYNHTNSDKKVQNDEKEMKGEDKDDYEYDNDDEEEEEEEEEEGKEDCINLENIQEGTQMAIHSSHNFSTYMDKRNANIKQTNNPYAAVEQNHEEE
jgi:hypothetical protein